MYKIRYEKCICKSRMERQSKKDKEYKYEIAIGINEHAHAHAWSMMRRKWISQKYIYTCSIILSNKKNLLTRLFSDES